jgi:poly-gamma-glutamate capsule biosynthesis protein CapA/YwtB (metallophosphatase superfamily)
MMLKRINLIFILTIICLGAFLLIFNVKVNSKNHNIPLISKKSESIKKITFLAAGDIMFHIPQIENAYNGKTYDFKPAFEDIRSTVQSADVSLANFEAVILPSKKNSGFPRFNVPAQTLESIKYCGFDLLSLANNHIMDYGQEGMNSTKLLIEKAGMSTIGAGKSSDTKYAVINKNGIKLGIIAYTLRTNFLVAARGTLNYLDSEKIRKDIKTLKSISDYIIVYLHSGTEYVRNVDEKERMFFRSIADMGADCVLNSHPHVARESEIYKTEGRNVFINYSLGNLLSNQNDKYTDIGLIIKLDIVKLGKLTKLQTSEILPVYRLRYKASNKINYKIVFCEKIDEYKEKIGIRDIAYVKDISNQFAPETVAVFNNK